jgi:hypothetical protein
MACFPCKGNNIAPFWRKTTGKRIFFRDFPLFYRKNAGKKAKKGDGANAGREDQAFSGSSGFASGIASGFA